MIATTRLQRATELVHWLHGQVNESTLPATTRHRVSAACLAIAQEHHSGIVLLMLHGNFASAFTLVRAAIEAFIRGAWLWQCATDDEVIAFSEDEDPPTSGHMIKALEATPFFSNGDLSSMKKSHWRAMCSFAHTGGLHTQRWQTPEAIEPTYDVAELKATLAYAELAGSLSVITMCNMLGDDDRALRVLAKYAALTQ